MAWVSFHFSHMKSVFLIHIFILSLSHFSFISLYYRHVTAVTVSPEYRRLGVAKTLMTYLENISSLHYNAYFVDLFVRKSNNLAQFMYTNLNYVIYRRVIEYYSGEEDAYGMFILIFQ